MLQHDQLYNILMHIHLNLGHDSMAMTNHVVDPCSLQELYLSSMHVRAVQELQSSNIAHMMCADLCGMQDDWCGLHY